MEDILKFIIDKNPGIVNVALTGVLLPLGILLTANRHSRKLKEIEKQLELRYKSKDDIREQEKKVYASLSKILFDVQQLHVALSGTCVDSSCIEGALIKFDSSISKCHDDIANNMLYLSSEVINLIYQFYNYIGRLKIELQELNKRKEYQIANVTVFYSSKNLADTVIEIQDLFISQRIDLKVQFDKTKQQMMQYCCGNEPPKELKQEYEKIKKTITEHF